MVNRRVLLPMLVVAFALLGPGAGARGAAVAWPRSRRCCRPAARPTSPRTTNGELGGGVDDSGRHTSTSAQRPRGGPWGAPEDLQPDAQAAARTAKIASLPDGAARRAVGDPDRRRCRAAASSPGGAWSWPQAIALGLLHAALEDVRRAAPTAASALCSGARRSAPATTAVKPPGASAFDAAAVACRSTSRPRQGRAGADGSADAPPRRATAARSRGAVHPRTSPPAGRRLGRAGAR